MTNQSPNHKSQNKLIQTLFIVILLVISYSSFVIAPVMAQVKEITNPALGNNIVGLSAGAGLAFYIAQLWKTVVIVGGLAVMLYLIWGGLQWLMAGGDKAKLEEAHHKITNSLIGLGVLVASFAVIYFIGGVLKIDLLKPVFPTNY